MNIESIEFETYLRVVSCGFIAVGLGWTFAEVRRLFINTGDFVSEAIHDYHDKRMLSLVCGVLYLFVGTLGAFHAFDWGPPRLSFTFPYMEPGPEFRRFAKVFGGGLVGWCVFSAFSTSLFPPPLFSERVTAFLCRMIRGALLLLLGGVVAMSIDEIGDDWKADGFGLFFAVLALLGIHSGQVPGGTYFWLWSRPPITCAERPFPYVSYVLFLIGIAAFCLMAGDGKPG